MCSMQRWQQQALKRAIRGVDFPGFRFAANLLPHLQAARSGVRERGRILSALGCREPIARGAHVEPTWSPREAHGRNSSPDNDSDSVQQALFYLHWASFA